MFLLIMGFTGLMLGCMLMFPLGLEVEEFTKGLAVAMICPLYAILAVFLVTVPFRGALKKKLNSLE